MPCRRRLVPVLNRKMGRKKHRLSWVLFSLFTWLHLAQGLYPLPSQRTSEIHAMATEAVENSKLLTEQGVEPDKYMQMNKNQWKTGYRSSFWVLWTTNLLFFSSGVFVTLLLYLDSRPWPVLLALVSIITLWVTVPPLFELAANFEPFSRFWGFWSKRLGSFYHLFVWPLYCVVLLGLSIYGFVTRRGAIAA